MDKYLAHFVTEMRGYCDLLDVIASTLRERGASASTILAAAQEMQRLAHTITGLSSSLELDDFPWIGEGLEACALGIAADPVGAYAAGNLDALAGLLDLAVGYLRQRVAAMEAAGTFQTRAGQDEALLRRLDETIWRLSGQLSQAEPSEEGQVADLSEEDQAILRAFAESDLSDAQEEPPPDSVHADEEDTSGSPDSALPDGALPDDVSAEMRLLFQVETEDDLRLMQSALARLEMPEDRSTAVLEMRRTVHKIKGAAATLDLQVIASLAHCLEDLLDLLMDRRLPYGSLVLDALVHGVFEMETSLQRLAAAEPESSAGLERLRAVYDRLLAGAENNSSDPSATQPDSQRLALATRQASLAPVEPSGADVAGAPPDAPSERNDLLTEREQTLRVDVRKLDQIMGLISDLAANRATTGQMRHDIAETLGELRRTISRMHEVVRQLDEEVVKHALRGTPSHPLQPEPAQAASFALRGTPSRPQTVSRPQIEEAAQPRTTAPLGPPSHPLGSAIPSLEEQLARRAALGLERFDNEQSHLVRVLGESVNDVTTVSETLQRLLIRLGELADTQENLTGNIQRDITHLRLVPIRQVVPRLHLTVRMVAQEQNKQIVFQTKGETTEIDRDIIEAITSPLVQLVRNCAVHGIESVEERRARGKPETGTIWLHAYYSGNEVSIEVGDDGSGIHYQRLVAAALAGGKITPEEAERITPEEAVHLMLLPNLSTSPEVTTISGRGVGMDLVRAAVEKLKGTLHIHNRPGEGTTFHIRLPISLGVMRALFVRANQQTYAIPFSAVERIWQGGRQTTRPNIRLIKLTDLLGFGSASAESGDEVPPNSALYVPFGHRLVGVQVDEVLQEREIVVKHLPAYLRRRGVRGVTLSSTGEMLLLLDLPELVHRAVGSTLLRAGAAGESEAPPQPAKTEPTPSRLVQAESPPSEPARLGPIKIDLAAREPARKGITVLVVDDSQPMRRTLEWQLTRAGYQVLSAKDGLDALEMITTKQRPHLVLLDIEMPRMDGYELLSRLRSQRQYSSMPIVMLTSRAADKHRQHAMELGANAYLVKPCPHDELLQTIAALTR